MRSDEEINAPSRLTTSFGIRHHRECLLSPGLMDEQQKGLQEL